MVIKTYNKFYIFKFYYVLNFAYIQFRIKVNCLKHGYLKLLGVSIDGGLQDWFSSIPCAPEALSNNRVSMTASPMQAEPIAISDCFGTMLSLCLPAKKEK